MTRAQMRGVLRRRLQDPLIDREGNIIDQPVHLDAELDELLNLALMEVQEVILDIDPGAFISIDTFDLVSGQERYVKPPGFLYEYDLSIADAGYGTGWRPLRRETYRGTRLRFDSSTVEYSSLGRWFFLSPIPNLNIDEGLQLTWVYSLSMSSDQDVPQIALPLHNMVVDMALLLALTETPENEAQDRVQIRIEKKMQRLPIYYRRSRGEPPSIQPALRQAALSRRNRAPRDVYFSR